MGFHSIYVLCLVVSAAHVVFGELWEFGKTNLPGSLKIVHKEGRMGLFEHTKKIKLPVPQCYVLTYVRVEVKNLISTPEVQFNINTNIVTIHYPTLSSSLSSFDIMGKGVWIPGCSPPARTYYG
ncbi:hypothetical protein PYW08_015583 [Mythimna loreyi]|uniref:Uncharacterized protein n=1 Tax=Mythimna loreyi TaxID=667449 RepID=A0ACC2QWL5_9NEOP|nr:hypothetical protein PYW08_015583 [Mythimna loreyi]